MFDVLSGLQLQTDKSTKFYITASFKNFVPRWHFHRVKLRRMRIKVLNLKANNFSHAIYNVSFEDVTNIILLDNILWKILCYFLYALGGLIFGV